MRGLTRRSLSSASALVSIVALCGVSALTGCRLGDAAQTPTQGASAKPARGSVAGPRDAKAAQLQADGAPAAGQPAAVGGARVPADAAQAGIVHDPSQPRGEAPKPKPAAQACATDADCMVQSLYCGGCSCQASNARVAERCRPEERVNCVANPCLDKTARCEQGRCTLVSALR